MINSHVLTIILPPDYSQDLNTVIQSFTDHLSRMKIADYTVQILSEECAADIFFTDQQLDTNHSVVSTLKGICQHQTGFDWFIQKNENRRKKMLIADMDSTMITIECIDELADFAGLKDQVSAITERAMQGGLDFEDSLRERVALLKGLDAEILQKCYETRLTYTKGANRLLATMGKNGAVTALVSGGFTFFTQRVADTLGFETHRANELEIIDGKLTGKIIPPISDSQTKIDTLHSLAEQHGFDMSEILAVGDGANDIPMIKGAGIGTAYKAKEKARQAADFTIDYTDLSALLYIQGYSDKDIINHL